MNKKSFYSVLAFICFSLFIFSSCSKEEQLIENAKKDIALSELRSLLDAGADKSVTVHEDYKMPETDIIGTLYNVNYNDEFNEDLLITDKEPKFDEKTTSIRKTMSVWVDGDSGQGYWSCGGAAGGRCVRILGITIAW